MHGVRSYGRAGRGAKEHDTIMASGEHDLVCVTYKRDVYELIAKSGPDANKYKKNEEILQVIVDNNRPLATGRGQSVLECNRVMFLSGWNLDAIMPASGISQDY